jgi:hypothetical protein
MRDGALRGIVATLAGSRLTVIGGLAVVLAALVLVAALIGAYPVSRHSSGA